MDYLLSVFFNSRTTDKPIDKAQQTMFPDFDPKGTFSYYAPWKWHWRQSVGPGWFETGNLTHPAASEEAALGKLTLRVWNRDTTVKAMPKAQIVISVTDQSGQDQYPKVNSIFTAFKYEDIHGPQIVPFDDTYVGAFKIVLSDVPGGKESNADYGDQRMRSWDVGEFYFSSSPHKKYDFEVSLWVEFDQTQSWIFVIDPEMDIGLELVTVIE